MEVNHQNGWEQCLAIIRDNISPEQYDAWFKPVTALSFKDGALTVRVPSPYFLEHLEAHYLHIMVPALRRVFGADVKLFYSYDQVNHEPDTKVTLGGAMPSTAIPVTPPPAANPFKPQVEEVIDSQLNPRYTFETYCLSHSNQIARSIGEAIANDSKMKTFNPLVIFGPTGVGKTHLIQAIGIRIKERNPRARVLYVTARLFESQYTAAVRQNRINDFINFYQSIDTLILDDIQDLIGNKPGTQNTFFHIFNHLHQNSRQIILSSDVCPSHMEGMEERLLSRFKWGMIAELERPDLALRKDVLIQKAQQDGLQIPDEVLDYIATKVTDSVRELEGIVVSLMAHATVLGCEVTLDLARAVLANAVKINKPVINFEMVTEQVCSHFKVDVDQIFTSSRKREISDARQVVMYLAKKWMKMPLTAIGTRLSRGHATVLHGCKNIEDRLMVEKPLQEAIAEIEKHLA
ncbi:MAG: chromosomal replication initiator protein DnaA [Bacteroidales bacterium]|nr:chromosomal replication initiator protein DnaA [Bacteroidales bacterium]MCD8395533.1 chromosomal replication initiator protein DnaA [Bacteroidales bacterium]